MGIDDDEVLVPNEHVNTLSESEKKNILLIPQINCFVAVDLIKWQLQGDRVPLHSASY